MKDFESTAFYADGNVMPPWIFAPDSHPYSIQWRMGAEEDYLMTFSEWFYVHVTSIEQRINFFKSYPPPPRWLGWMADAIWDLEPMDEEFDYSFYFNQLKEEGFEGTELYLEDLNDEQWT